MMPTIPQGAETPWRIQDPLYTEYRVTAAESHFPDSAPGARLRVLKPRTEYVHNTAVVDSRPYSQDVHGDRVRTQASDGPGGQRSLFDVEHHHPYVDLMATHPDYRAHIPTMLGVAEIETRARYGEGLRSSNDLSVHSSQLVHRLAQAGATKAPSDEMRNKITANNYKKYEVSTRRSMPGRYEDVPDSTTSMGRQFVRNMLRQPKKAVNKAAAGVSAKKGVQQEMFK